MTARIAVVTGGASGIGQACCQVLASKGWRVVVADIDEAGAKRVAAEVGGVSSRLDVGDEAGTRQEAARIEREAGPVEGLVNSAGIIAVPKAPEDLSMADWDRVTHIDQRGTYVANLAFGQAMTQRGLGAIVNIASVAGMRSFPLHAYAPAKAAVIAISECLAAEWGRKGVRVNTVSPGFTVTPALQAKFDTGERSPDAMIAHSALDRLIRPVDIANACAFLLSDEAAAITGINIPVDAGWLCANGWKTYPGIRGNWP
ncbi:MAG: SDR family oxidoreductase [Betaproteobacteria bacterium]|nr:SDR family oxidoreductase [Betaproteobacteria bacterium]